MLRRLWDKWSYVRRLEKDYACATKEIERLRALVGEYRFKYQQELKKSEARGNRLQVIDLAKLLDRFEEDLMRNRL